MKENLGGRENPGIIKRYTKFIFGKSEDSEDMKALLAPGKIEQLVREGRTPLLIRTMGILDEKANRVTTSPLYEVPPVGFAGKDMKDVIGSMGLHIFVNKLGVRRMGSTFMLDNKQVEEVEARISAEKERLGITSQEK